MKSLLLEVVCRFALIITFIATLIGVQNTAHAQENDIASMIDSADEMVIKYAPARWLERPGLAEAELSDSWIYRVSIRCMGGCRRAAPMIVSLLDRAQRANVECSQNFAASIEFRTSNKLGGIISVHVTEACLSFEGKGYRLEKGILGILETLPITHW